MGAPQLPKPVLPGPETRPDKVKAQLNALAFAETERRLRESQGRNSMFLTTGPQTPKPRGLRGPLPTARSPQAFRGAGLRLATGRRSPERTSLLGG